jgi:hypothetical protein
MTDTIIMRGAYAITDPRLGASGVIPSGSVVIIDGTVKETGPFAETAPRYPGAQVWLLSAVASRPVEALAMVVLCVSKSAGTWSRGDQPSR